MNVRTDLRGDGSMRATLSWMMTGLILMSGAVMAQTPQDPAFAGIELTFTSADLRSAMTESEQEEFAETRRKLRELKQTSEDPGAKESVREAADAYGRILREQFEQDFGYYRGFVDSDRLWLPDPDEERNHAVYAQRAFRRPRGLALPSLEAGRPRAGWSDIATRYVGLRDSGRT